MQQAAAPQSQQGQGAAIPCPYITIPLEVAQDERLSDGAVLLFGEVYGLCRAYGQCFASDAHFQSRRSKGRSTVQRHITELSERGHLYVVAHGKGRRELRVAERYLGGKDRADRPENGHEDARRPENGADARTRLPEIENAADPECPKNEIRKTPESPNKNQEKRTTPSPSSRVAPLHQLSPHQEKRLREAVRLLDDARNEADYRSLFLQASERGRLDAWEVAVASTKKARLTSGKMQKAPIAYFRTVLMRSWDTDRDCLREKSRAAAQSPSPTSPTRSCRADERPDNFDDDLADEGLAEEHDGLGDEADADGPAYDGGRRRGSDALIGAEAVARREYSSCPPRRSEAAEPAEDFGTIFSALPAEVRDNILARAEDEVRRRSPAFWSDAKGSKVGERLVQQQVSQIVEREGLTAR